MFGWLVRIHTLPNPPYLREGIIGFFDLFIIFKLALSSPSPEVGEVRWGVMFKDDVLLLGWGKFLLRVLDPEASSG